MIHNFNAGAAIAPYTIVKYTANPYEVTPAAAATDKIIGVSKEVNVAQNQPVDVQLDGIGFVKVGAAGVTQGDLVTSDVNGNAVTAAPAAAANNRTLGMALETGVAGWLDPGLKPNG
jgi:hypothetical protein